MTGTSDSEAPRAPSATATVFVSDPSAEAERIAQALRSGGYLVVDVPLSMLVARVAVQRPRVILVDADSEGALESIARMRELPDADGVDVLFCGRGGDGLVGVEDALAHEGSGFFPRPVDVPALVKKIEALTGGAGSVPPPSKHPSGIPSAPPAVVALPPALPPPSIRAEKQTPSQPPAAFPAIPPAARLSQPPPMSSQSIAPEVAVRRGTHVQAPLSPELQQLLAEAEDRIGARVPAESHPPSPEEEIEAVLPEEILAALDEPLEEEEDEDDPNEHMLGTHNRATTSGGRKHTTGTGSRQQSTTGSGHGSAQTNDGSQFLQNRTQGETGATTNAGRTHGVSTPPQEEFNDGLSEVPPPNDATRGPLQAFGGAAISPVGHEQMRSDSAPPPRTEHAPSAFSTTLGSELLAQNLSSFDARPPSIPTDTSSANALPAVRSEPPPPALFPSRKAESVPPPPAAVPSVLGPGDAPRTLARAIASRVTGTLCFESKDGVRRAVLREGDLVTTASGVDDESLLAFLGARGDLPRERLAQLAGRFATFGRHAGAALVAHGYLRQDQLWPVLRAHAEWILGRAILTPEGTALIEPEPPGRLRGEPSVFGGSTGAEVFVEVVRRVVSTDDAITRLGGTSSRVGPGENSSLLTECALTAGEADSVKAAEGLTVGEVLANHPESDMASLLYALGALGVMEVLRSIDGVRKSTENAVSVDALDVDAIRARVRARIEIVDEGDYFAVLGVSRSATGYEVKRAFLELRRAFDPARLLTPPVADLAPDVRKIVTVLEEAYEILKDGARRERYRRAIDNSPS